MYNNSVGEDKRVLLGDVHLTAASFHLYWQHWDAAHKITFADDPQHWTVSKAINQRDILAGDWGVIERGLLACRDKVQNGAAWNPRPR